MHRTSPFLGGIGTDLFPELIRIEVLMIFCRFMIDSGVAILQLCQMYYGFAVVLGTLCKQNLANVFVIWEEREPTSQYSIPTDQFFLL